MALPAQTNWRDQVRRRPGSPQEPGRYGSFASMYLEAFRAPVRTVSRSYLFDGLKDYLTRDEIETHGKSGGAREVVVCGN
jgi:hypothetical protein